MIAKRAPRRAPHRSRFGRLANYILRAARGGEAVRFARAVNCGFDAIDLAVKEIEATQALNTRARSDLTYHLVASFPAADSGRLTGAVLEDAETTLVAVLGYAEHQRLSVVHDDTDHVHLHIAINKAHPETLRARTPRGDFYALGAACAELERRHDLTLVPHVGRPARDRSPPALPTSARDMEAHSAQASFHSWIAERRPILAAELAAAGDWPALHTALAAHDLKLVERGAGFAVAARDHPAATIKASALHRSLARAALEDRLGPFEAPAPVVAHERHAEAYRPAPLTDRGALWERYQDERAAATAAKTTAIERHRDDRETEIARIRTTYGQRRAAIMADVTLSRSQRRELYRTSSIARKKAYADARRDCRTAIAAVDEENPVATWGDWLHARALEGDAAATAALRARAARATADRDRPNALSGEGEGAPIVDLKPRAVRHNGDPIHDLPGQPRDAGDQVLAQTGAESAAGAVALAARKWNRGALRVDGDARFARAAAVAAGAARTPVAFADPVLERQRRAVASLTAAQRAAFRAAETWVEGRNAVRARTADDKPLRQHVPGERGRGEYAGVRNVREGVQVVLVELSAEILAVRISDPQAAAFRAHPRGSRVQYHARGHITFETRQRSR